MRGRGREGTERTRRHGEGGREEEWGVGGQEQEKGCIQTYQPITIHVQLLIESWLQKTCINFHLGNRNTE